MARAIGVHQLLSKKFKTLPFTGDWYRCMGEPGTNFRAIAIGDSGNGKTTFMTMFCKMLASLNLGKVAYNSIEEGESSSMQDSWLQMNMKEVAGNLVLIDKEPMAEFINRLKKSRAIKFAVLDSIQMSRMTPAQYDALKKAAGKRIALIFISHSDGKQPVGALAKEIRFDADIKIYVEGFVAMITSRFGKKGGFVIWKKGAEDYWGGSLNYLVEGKSIRQAKVKGNGMIGGESKGSMVGGGTNHGGGSIVGGGTNHSGDTNHGSHLSAVKGDGTQIKLAI